MAVAAQPEESLQSVKWLLEATWSGRGRQWQSKPYYPIFCDLVGRRCLVVGAGKIGEGKVRGLLDAGAAVHVVSLTASDTVRKWADEVRIELSLRAYETSDLDGCFLAIAATESNGTNIGVFNDAEARGMLCNVVDVTPLCNFILPSIHREGDLVVAISTAGASPALARRIRLEIAERYGEEFGVALELLGSLRTELKRRYPNPDDRKIIFERMVYSNLIESIRACETDKIEAWIDRCANEGPNYATAEEHQAALKRWLASAVERERGQ